MKIRTDFITNSSSSSFIIRKSHPVKTKEELFQYLKQITNKYIQKRKELINYCKNDNRFIVEITNQNTYKIKTKYDDKKDYNKVSAINKELERMFGMDLWENLNNNFTWLKHNTYKQYIANTQHIKHHTPEEKPFTILDLRTAPKSEEEKFDRIETINWYFPCFFDSSKMFQDESACLKYCKNKDKELCKKIRDNQRNKNFVPDTFGNLCVFSECGYLPDYIVKKLQEQCDYYCNHMG